MKENKIVVVAPIYSKCVRYMMLTLSKLRVRLIVLLSVLFIPAEWLRLLMCYAYETAVYLKISD